jgi:simple sugar transport system substrate-binding protein
MDVTIDLLQLPFLTDASIAHTATNDGRTIHTLTVENAPSGEWFLSVYAIEGGSFRLSSSFEPGGFAIAPELVLDTGSLLFAEQALFLDILGIGPTGNVSCWDTVIAEDSTTLRATVLANEYIPEGDLSVTTYYTTEYEVEEYDGMLAVSESASRNSMRLVDVSAVDSLDQPPLYLYTFEGDVPTGDCGTLLYSFIAEDSRTHACIRTSLRAIERAEVLVPREDIPALTITGNIAPIIVGIDSGVQYVVDIQESGNLKARLFGYGAGNDYDLYLLDEDGELIDSSLCADPEEELEIPLPPGRYLIQIESVCGAGEFTLDLSMEVLQPLRAGFIYVGPIGDTGWTHAHDAARIICENTFPWLETVFVESVAEGEEGPIIDELVRNWDCDVIFATSFGFMDGMLAAAQRYPDRIFAHCLGFNRNPNMMTYTADFYQISYLNGLMAGALSETGKIAYVAAFPIPEERRHINAFTIGVREVNPQAEVDVRWVYSWYDPADAQAATEALIAEGCDVFACTDESGAVLRTAAENGFPSFAYCSPMYGFAPDHCVSGHLFRWEAIYLDFLEKVYYGVYSKHNLQDMDYWWLLAEGAVEMGAEPGMPINPVFADQLKAFVHEDPELGPTSVYDLVFIRMGHMSDPSMMSGDPFDGPIYDRNGILRVHEGGRISPLELITMEWAVEGVVGPWPR